MTTPHESRRFVTRRTAVIAIVGAAQELHVGVASPFVAASKAHPALRVSTPRELERLAALLQAGGIAVRWADPAEIPGATRFFVDDPWGNRLELVA